MLSFFVVGWWFKSTVFFLFWHRAKSSKISQFVESFEFYRISCLIWLFFVFFEFYRKSYLMFLPRLFAAIIFFLVLFMMFPGARSMKYHRKIHLHTLLSIYQLFLSIQRSSLVYLFVNIMRYFRPMFFESNQFPSKVTGWLWNFMDFLRKKPISFVINGSSFQNRRFSLEFNDSIPKFIDFLRNSLDSLCFHLKFTNISR